MGEGYNESLDQLRQEWDNLNNDGTGIIAGIYCYNDGWPKLQISRKKDHKFVKLGRLSSFDLKWLLSMGEIIQKHMDTFKPASKPKDDVPF